MNGANQDIYTTSLFHVSGIRFVGVTEPDMQEQTHNPNKPHLPGFLESQQCSQ
jgi:hypothetical protein